MRFDWNAYIKDNKIVNPTICPKCKIGKMESICGGRIHRCNNPSCGNWNESLFVDDYKREQKRQ